MRTATWGHHTSISCTSISLNYKTIWARAPHGCSRPNKHIIMKEFTKYTDIERLYTSAPYIKQLHDHKHKTKAAVVIILGVMIMALPAVINMHSEAISITLPTVGLLLALAGVALCVKSTRQLIYTPNGQTLIQGAATYDLSCCPTLRSIMEEGPSAVSRSDMRTDPNGGIRVDYLVSADHQVLAIEAKRFDNLMWLPLAPNVILFTDEEAQQAIKALSIDQAN